jgi:hypothetical protein
MTSALARGPVVLCPSCLFPSAPYDHLLMPGLEANRLRSLRMRTRRSDVRSASRGEIRVARRGCVHLHPSCRYAPHSLTIVECALRASMHGSRREKVHESDRARQRRGEENATRRRRGKCHGVCLPLESSIECKTPAQYLCAYLQSFILLCNRCARLVQRIK